MKEINGMSIYVYVSNSEKLNQVAKIISESVELKDLPIDSGHSEWCLANVGHKSLLTFAIAKGYAHSDEFLFHTYNNSQAIVIDALLNHPDIASIINSQDDRGNTALHLACMHRDVSLIKRLIALGADTNLQNKMGQTPRDLVEQMSYLKVNIALGEYTGTTYLWLAHPETFTLKSKKKWENSQDDCLKLLPIQTTETLSSKNKDPELFSQGELGYVSYDQLKTFMEKFKPEKRTFTFFQKENTIFTALHEILSNKKSVDIFSINEVLGAIGLACKTNKECEDLLVDISYTFQNNRNFIEADIRKFNRCTNQEQCIIFELGMLLRENIRKGRSELVNADMSRKSS